MLDDNHRWILSFYRESEIAGSLFFGRLARSLRPGAIQADMTRQFADEALHARHWTDCLQALGSEPLRLGIAYQDRYLEAAGMPANLMEVLALTQVFERRVINQYARHRRAPALPRLVADTFTRIMDDERWHLRWVGDALRGLHREYGDERVNDTLRRYQAADREVYRTTLDEHAERMAALLP